MEKRMITTDVTEEDLPLEGSLRPQTLDEYIGQEKTKKTLKIYIEAAKLRSIWLFYEGNPSLHSAFSCKVSGYVSMILDILFLFPTAVHTIRTALWQSLYENIFPMKGIFFPG